MKRISISQITAAAFFVLLSIVSTCVESFTAQQQQPSSSYLSRKSSTWNELMPQNNNQKVGSLTTKKTSSPRPSFLLYAGKGTDDGNNKSGATKQMVGYNDDAFGLVFLTGGILSKDPDFVVTFVVLSAIAAIASNSQSVDTRLPGLVAMATLVLTPIVAYLHGTIVDGTGIWAAPQPVEIGLCFVSLAWSFATWAQGQNE
mmetsp:Transcript_31236/g.75174  ORF Transcript_31236/g.75174 Transcript_31236/m.75174 type:complete len:201 (+) Transcript_31236:2312-2914(+)